MSRNAPIVQAYRIEHPVSPSLVFWCVHCRRWHTHGAGDGHRVAHCKDGAPYTRGGYVLKSIGPLPRALRRRYDRDSRPRPEDAPQSRQDAPSRADAAREGQP